MQDGITLSSAGYDGSNTWYESYIRAGWLMGKITSSGLWVPCKRTKTNGAGSATATLVVDNAAAFKAADVLVIGGTTGTISSIVYSTNTITLSATKTWGDNEPVYVADGSQTARGILLDEEVKLWDVEKTNNVAKPGQLLFHGGIESSKVLGDLTACLEDPENLLGGITFWSYQMTTDVAPLPYRKRWKPVTIAASITLTSADSGTHFFATAAATVTLPALASAGEGFVIRVTSLANTDTAITAPSCKLIADGSATSTTAT